MPSTPAMRLGESLDDLVAFYDAQEAAVTAINDAAELLRDGFDRDAFLNIAQLVSTVACPILEYHPESDDLFKVLDWRREAEDALEGDD